MREIALDTETTGLDPTSGHRLIEIGCVELINRTPTKNSYHVFINPERDVPNEAYEIHGLSTEFLADKPKFSEVVDEFLKFVDDSTLVIHNAEFDMNFINWELSAIGYESISNERVVDTLALARAKHPAGPNSLDALCTRYKIDNSKRIKHGALLDAELLSEVYIELTGGKQTSLDLETTSNESTGRCDYPGDESEGFAAKVRPSPLPPRLTEKEIEAHQLFVEGMGEKAIWSRINKGA